MPDGLNTAGDLFRSSILRQGLEDTQYPQQQIAGMMQGMQPEQMAAFFQSPQVQAQFRSFGIDPQAMLQNTRQSPFLPNSFMQAHPHLGGIMSGAMANAAATPEAPLVSGAGSGISRAMQGMYGGPELLRHYQLAQMMAPMGALGSMMPTFAEQRRRAIEEAIVKETQQRMQGWPQQLEDVHAQRTEPRIHQGQYGRDITEYHEGAPAGGQQGADLVQTGQRPPITMLSPGAQGQQAPMPGYGLTPEQQTGWTERFEPYTKEQQAQLHPERQSLAAWRQALLDANIPEDQADKLVAEAERARAQKDLANRSPGKGASTGWTEKGAAGLEEKKGDAIKKLDSEFSAILSKYGKYDKQGNLASLDEEAWKRDDPGSYANYFQQRQQIEDNYTEAGRALGGTYPGYEYASRGQHSNVPKQNPFISPGASPGGAQAGGAGGQTSQGTAVAPQANGLPPGMVFDEHGIPRQAPQQPTGQQAPPPQQQ